MQYAIRTTQYEPNSQPAHRLLPSSVLCLPSVQSLSENIVYSISIYAYAYILCLLCGEFYVVFSNGANPHLTKALFSQLHK